MILDLDGLETPVLIVDADLKVTAANASFLRAAGLECKPETILEVLPVLERSKYQRKLSRKQRFTVTVDGVGRDGPTPFEYVLRPMDDGGGNWMVEAIDQTRMREKEMIAAAFSKTIEGNNRLLAHQQRTTVALLDNMRQGVFTVNRAGIVTSPVSEFSQQVFGKDIAGERVIDLLFCGLELPDDLPWKKIGFNIDEWSLVNDTLPRRVFYAMPEDGGPPRPRELEISVTPIPRSDDASVIARLMFVVEDVTELALLARKTAAQNTTIHEQHTNMRTILDSARQGFLVVDPQGRLPNHFSAVVEGWFGPPDDQRRALWDLFSRVDPRVAQNLEIGWDQLVDGIFPLDVAIDQLPGRFVADDRHFEVEYRPVGAQPDGSFESILIVLSDRTVAREQERFQRRQTEFLGCLSRALKDRKHFQNFINEVNDLFTLLGHTDSDLVFARGLHTIKGNVASWGLDGLAEDCHALENLDLDGSKDARSAGLCAIEDEWGDILENLAFLLVEDDAGSFHLEGDDYYACLELSLVTTGESELTAKLLDWLAEPACRPMTRLAEQAKELAGRLGKGPLEVHVDDGGVRVPQGRLDEFWSVLTHVTRNSIDHGYPDSASSTSPCMHWLAARVQGRLVIEISDNGQGIAWDMVRKQAEACGWASATHEDLCAAIMRDSFSTKETVTLLSGRGIGLAAVKYAATQLGGEIQIESQPGAGVRFIFSFPETLLALDARAVVRQWRDLRGTEISANDDGTAAVEDARASA